MKHFLSTQHFLLCAFFYFGVSFSLPGKYLREVVIKPGSRGFDKSYASLFKSVIIVPVRQLCVVGVWYTNY